VYPATANEAGVASEAELEAGDGEPLVHRSVTVTEAALFGTKFFWTVKGALVCSLVIVHEAEPPTLIATDRQLAWLAM
jgi:hypothetical protein